MKLKKILEISIVMLSIIPFFAKGMEQLEKPATGKSISFTCDTAQQTVNDILKGKISFLEYSRSLEDLDRYIIRTLLTSKNNFAEAAKRADSDSSTEKNESQKKLKKLAYDFFLQCKSSTAEELTTIEQEPSPTARSAKSIAAELVPITPIPPGPAIRSPESHWTVVMPAQLEEFGGEAVTEPEEY